MPIKPYPQKEYYPEEPTKETSGYWDVQGAAMWGVAPQHWFLFVDVNRCIGCFGCEVACKAEHDLLVGPRLIRVMQIGPRKVGGELRSYYMPMMCMHCGKPPCMPACPVQAIKKLDNGIVLINEEQCIGCRKCAEVCPFGAIQFDALKGVAIKCDYCIHRIKRGLMPACVTKCATRAMYFGDLNEIVTLIREKVARGVGIGLLKDITYSGPAAPWPERQKFEQVKAPQIQHAIKPAITST